MSLANLEPTEELLQDCFIYERNIFKDVRGSFSKLYSKNFTNLAQIMNEIKEINLSQTSEAGTIRGMHYQNSPYSETKLVTCVSGEIADVVIDLRQSSTTYLQHKITILSEQNHKSILIPKGFAHGFQSLSKNSKVLYCVDEVFMPSHQAGINPLDSFFNIAWPLVTHLISTQDQGWPMWENFDNER